jgi:hypothetical protein
MILPLKAVGLQPVAGTGHYGRILIDWKVEQ